MYKGISAAIISGKVFEFYKLPVKPCFGLIFAQF